MERNPEVHRIKVLTPYYQDLVDRKKSFELRINDRDYRVGDTVILEEYTGEFFTGRGIRRKIKYVLKDCPQFGLKNGYCIFCW